MASQQKAKNQKSSKKTKIRRRPKIKALSLDDLMEKIASGGMLQAYVKYDRSDMNVSTSAQRIKPNLKTIIVGDSADLSVEPADFLDTLNAATRAHRRRLYYARLAHNPKATRIVSEGNSWHLYPIIIEEIVDQLNKDTSLAIYSTDGAGDKISNMWSEKEEGFRGFEAAIAAERPSVFLLDGGGNDLLSGRMGPDGNVIGNLYFHLNDYQAGMTIHQLIKPSLNGEIGTVENYYRLMLTRCQRFSFLKKIIIHGYDYAFPQDDIWLGKPMQKRGIPSDLQHDIVKEIMNRFHRRLVAVAQDYDQTSQRVICADVRNIVKKRKDGSTNSIQNLVASERLQLLSELISECSPVRPVEPQALEKRCATIPGKLPPIRRENKHLLPEGRRSHY